MSIGFIAVMTLSEDQLAKPQMFVAVLRMEQLNNPTPSQETSAVSGNLVARAWTQHNGLNRNPVNQGLGKPSGPDHKAESPSGSGNYENTNPLAPATSRGGFLRARKD